MIENKPYKLVKISRLFFRKKGLSTSFAFAILLIVADAATLKIDYVARWSRG